MVALRPNGSSHFHDLQAALSERRDGDLHFYAVDLLLHDGWDLKPCPQIERKRLLAQITGWGEKIRYCDHIEGEAKKLFAEAARLRLEGIICKRIDAPYRGRRNRSWLKVKAVGREEFVVLGWTPPGGARQGIGGLALGYHDPQGWLHYAGAVGAGFTVAELAELRARLDGMAAELPTLWIAGDDPDRATRWVRPELVTEVSFTAWSGEGRLRHPVFRGLRADKRPAEVVLELPDPWAARREITPVRGAGAASQTRWKGPVPPRKRSR